MHTSSRVTRNKSKKVHWEEDAHDYGRFADKSKRSHNRNKRDYISDPYDLN